MQYNSTDPEDPRAGEMGAKVGRGFPKPLEVVTEPETTVVCSPARDLCMTLSHRSHELLQKAAQI